MILTLALLFAAAPTWYEQSLEGWYYFQEASPALLLEEAQLVLDLKKKRQQDMLALALLAPTRENVANYIQAERQVHDQSSVFAKMWSDVLTGGRLDPVLSERYFLLLCFKGQEPQSQAAIEIGKAFAAANHWTLKGLCLDGERLAGFDCEIDCGLGQQLALDQTPCFYAVDPVENFIVPLGGEIFSSADLELRVIARCEP